MTFSTLLISLLILNYLFDLTVELLNLSRLSKNVPPEFADVYTVERYAKSQDYLRVNTKFDLIESAFTLTLLICAIALGAFDWWDQTVRTWSDTSEIRGLYFVAGISLAGQVLSLPFNIYDTFVIEERFGFNKTTAKTFVIDRLKGIALAILLGGPILFGFFWIWNQLGANAWIWAWGFLTVTQLFMLFIAPVTIMPLFNKYQPLPEGELKKAIEAYVEKVQFKMKGLFTMDGSRRSTKANAFFTGFGKFRRIVLFDTLIEKHTQEELLAVLAHEVGHYKLKHIFRQLALSLVVSAVTLYLMSIFAAHPYIFEAFNVREPSFYVGLMFFGIVYSPISTLVSMYSLYLSRKYEFEADDYSKKTFGNALALANALKKLSADSLSNLNPHPLKVFLEYTHPPVLQRIEKLKAVTS